MSKIQSIKCTNCGAPLKLLGGGRVMTVTCAYCKSVLDLNDNYKVLSNFKNVKGLHELPFDIGMKGKLKDIDYTIIGRVDYRGIEYPDTQWTDFLLFSPLYGYAWLTYEEGSLSYSRRERKFPNLEWNEITGHSHIVVGERTYETYDAYSAKISYVEGELTWVAKKNDNTSFIDLIDPPFGISAEKSKNEIEYYQSEYLEADEVYEAFSIPQEKRTTEEGFNPLKPFNRPTLKALSSVAFWALIIVAFLFVGMLFDGSGKNLTYFSADNKQEVNELFTLKSNRYLSTIQLKAPNKKSLNNFNIKLSKGGQTLFTLNQNNAYIFDPMTQKVKEKLNPWDKDAKEVRVYLHLEEKGLYHISISPVDKNLASSLLVNIEEKKMRMNYIVLLIIFLLFSLVLYKLMSWKYARKLDAERGLSLRSEDAPIGTASGNLSLWFFIFVMVIIILNINS